MTLGLGFSSPDCLHVVEKTSHPDEGNELLIGVFITPGKSRALEAHARCERTALRCVLTSCVCR